MWNERITSLIDKINYVANQVTIKNEIELQNSLKKKVLEINKAINHQLELYEISNKKCSFVYSDETKKIISDFIEAIDAQLNAKKFDKFRVNNINKKKNEFDTKIRANWNDFYSDYTYDTVRLLNVFKGVRPDRINTLLVDINNAHSWDNITLEKITKLDNSMKESITIISSINSDPKIYAFLTKMNSGNATFLDIDQDIIDWIRDKNISDRISIKFM